jgi:hypothetical protein
LLLDELPPGVGIMLWTGPVRGGRVYKNTYKNSQRETKFLQNYEFPADI